MYQDKSKSLILRAKCKDAYYVIGGQACILFMLTLTLLATTPVVRSQQHLISSVQHGECEFLPSNAPEYHNLS